MLFQVMLDLGVLLSSKIEETVVRGKTVYSVADGYLLACFDRDVTDEVVTEIAKRKPRSLSGLFFPIPLCVRDRIIPTYFRFAL